MRCLITGGAGFIGRHVATELLGRGVEVILYDSLDPQAHPDGPPDSIPAAASLIVGDVRDADALRAQVRRCDGVIHLAAAVGVAQSQYEIRHYCDVNVTGTATLAEILATETDASRPVVFASSMTQYGEGQYVCPGTDVLRRPALRTESDIEQGWEPRDPDQGTPLEPLPTSESAAQHGRNVYAQTKRMGEDLLLNLDATFGIRAATLRMFNVYGPGQTLSNPYTGVLAIFISQILNGRPPLIFEDGGQTRDFVHVRDVARVFADAWLGEARGVFNIGSGIGTTIGGVARTLCDRLGTDVVPNVTGTFRRGDVRHCTADIARAQATLDFVPQISLAEGLDDLVTWAQNASRPVDRTDEALAELTKFGLADV